MKSKMFNILPIYAHRGAYEVENTLSAFEKARKLGADGIELDIQITKDDELIVFHDTNLSRLAGVNKQVTDCLFQELSEIRIGKRFWRRITNKKIPSFKQVIEWANEHQIPLNVELKETLLTNTAPIINILQKLNLPKGSHFSSFHDELLKIVKMQRPDFETAIIVTRKFNWKLLDTMSHIDAVHAHKRYYKQLYFDYCIAAGKGMRFYSINGNEAFLSSPEQIVVGWITDYPEKVLRHRKVVQNT